MLLMIYGNNYSINHIKTTTNKKNYCLEIIKFFCRDNIISWKSVPTQKMSSFMFLIHTRDFKLQELSENGPEMKLNLSELSCKNQPV